MDTQRICVMGLGYIGLPTASLLATKGFSVHGVDVRAEVVDTINRGDIHIVEPELDVLVRSAVHSGNLKASLEPVEADIFVLAVPTPFGVGHAPDLSYVDAVKCNTSLGRIIEPFKKMYQAGFARTGWSDDRHGFTMLNRQRNVLQNPFTLDIRKPDVLKVDVGPLAGHRCRNIRLGNLFLCIEKKKDPFG